MDTQNNDRIRPEAIRAVRDRLLRYCANHVTELANKTNLSRATVSKFFNDQKIRAENGERIYDAALALLQEHAEKIQHRQRMELLLIEKNILPPNS